MAEQHPLRLTAGAGGVYEQGGALRGVGIDCACLFAGHRFHQHIVSLDRARTRHDRTAPRRQSLRDGEVSTSKNDQRWLGHRRSSAASSSCPDEHPVARPPPSACAGREQGKCPARARFGKQGDRAAPGARPAARRRAPQAADCCHSWPYVSDSLALPCRSRAGRGPAASARFSSQSSERTQPPGSIGVFIPRAAWCCELQLSGPATCL